MTLSSRLFLLFFLIAVSGYGQKQLVFLKNESVIARFTEGEYFKFKLKNKTIKEGYIMEVNEFSMITANVDTISFLSIDKVAGRRIKVRAGALGKALLYGGLGYIAIDQLNSLVGSTQSGFDDSDRNALILAGVGAGMIYIKPRYQKVGRGVVMRTIDYNSSYYKLDR